MKSSDLICALTSIVSHTGAFLLHRRQHLPQQPILSKQLLQVFSSFIVMAYIGIHPRRSAQVAFTTNIRALQPAGLPVATTHRCSPL